MATEEDIANLALSHLGDTATVASLNPPEGSAQSEHAARFYPIARDTLLEMHTWRFSTKRVALAKLTSNWPEWDFAYAKPSDASKVWAVLPPDATDDNSAPARLPSAIVPPGTPDWGVYTPQPFTMEVDASGAEVIYTDQDNAVARYTHVVTDTSRFSPLFVMALSWHLASMLAGPVIKGDAGAAEAKRATAMMQSYLSQAKESDANQQHQRVKHNVDWMTGR